MPETPLEALRSLRKTIEQFPHALAQVLVNERHQRQQMRPEQQQEAKERRTEGKTETAQRQRRLKKRQESPGEPLFPHLKRVQEEWDIDRRARWSLEGEQKSKAISERMKELRPPSFMRGFRRTASSLGGAPAQLLHQYDRFKEIADGIGEMWQSLFPRKQAGPAEPHGAEIQRQSRERAAQELNERRRQNTDWFRRGAQMRAAQQQRGYAGSVGARLKNAIPTAKAIKQPLNVGFSGMRARIQAANRPQPVSPGAQQRGFAGRVGALLKNRPRPQLPPSRPSPASLGAGGIRGKVFAAAREKAAARTAQLQRGFAGRVGAALRNQPRTAPTPAPVAPAPRPQPVSPPAPRPQPAPPLTPIVPTQERARPAAPPSAMQRFPEGDNPFLRLPSFVQSGFNGSTSPAVAPFLRRMGAAARQALGGSRIGPLGSTAAGDSRGQNVWAEMSKQLAKLIDGQKETNEKLEKVAQGNETESADDDVPQERFAGGGGDAVKTVAQQSAHGQDSGHEGGKKGKSVGDVMASAMDMLKLLGVPI